MRTVAEQLQFVVRYAQQDFDTFRPGDWLNLRDDMRQFLQYALGEPCALDESRLFTAELDPPGPEAYSEADFRALQQETRAVLLHLVSSRTEGVKWLPGDNRDEIWIALHVRVSPLYFGAMGKQPASMILAIAGPLRDVFLTRLILLLQGDPTEKILRCPGCGTLFYRIRKQQYCSHACANRSGVRKWRATDEGKQYERARASRRYRQRRAPAQVKARRTNKEKEAE